MKYNALAIKNWIIKTISPMGWSLLISRALPELLEVNQYFSASYIGKNTKWNEDELRVIKWYLKRIYNTEIPDEILWENGQLQVDYLELLSFDFFRETNALNSIKKSIVNFFKF